MKKYVFILAAIFVLAAVMISAPHTFAASPAANNICSGVQLTGTASCTDTTGLTNIVKTVINILSLIVGLTAVIFIIVGGFKFVTSSGDAQKVASARNTIIYAVVGLAVAALAQFIVAFVLSKVK